MNAAALYFGEVVHERKRPRLHQLRYNVFSMLLDVDQLDAISAKNKFFFSKGRQIARVIKATIIIRRIRIIQLYSCMRRAVCLCASVKKIRLPKLIRLAWRRCHK